MRRAGLAIALFCAVACSTESQDAALTAATLPHGTISLQPDRIRVGDVVEVEILVVTPAEHRVLPIQPPDAVPGFWLLDAEHLASEAQHPDRWLHRTKLRVRAHALGHFEWPAQSVEIEDRGGQRTRLELDARPFEIVSVASRYPERITPFSLRPPPRASESVGSGWAVALGAGGMLLVVLAFHALQRWRRRETEPEASAETSDAWIVAGDALQAAQSQCDSDPANAADLAAHALRDYVSRRTRLSAIPLTTPELAAARPPRRLRSQWPALLATLTQLDDVRFPADLDVAQRKHALRNALDSAQEFVRETTPRGLR